MTRTRIPREREERRKKDNINGFLHFLNPHPSTNRYLTSTPTITLYVLNNPPIPIDTSDPPIPYSTIPRLDSAIEVDRKLEKVQTWLETLERPP
jgi:hypothetical protein